MPVPCAPCVQTDSVCDHQQPCASCVNGGQECTPLQLPNHPFPRGVDATAVAQELGDSDDASRCAARLMEEWAKVSSSASAATPESSTESAATSASTGNTLQGPMGLLTREQVAAGRHTAVTAIQDLQRRHKAHDTELGAFNKVIDFVLAEQHKTRMQLSDAMSRSAKMECELEEMKATIDKLQKQSAADRLEIGELQKQRETDRLAIAEFQDKASDIDDIVAWREHLRSMSPLPPLPSLPSMSSMSSTSSM